MVEKSVVQARIPGLVAIQHPESQETGLFRSLGAMVAHGFEAAPVRCAIEGGAKGRRISGT